MNEKKNTRNDARLSPELEAQRRADEEAEWRRAAEAQAQKLVKSNSAVDAWWASLPAGRGPVIGGEPTGPLSLAERADRGLLADNPDWLPAQEELPLADVLWLECADPTNTDWRSALAGVIRTAVNVGKLVTDPDKPGVIQRDHYRQWRAQCQASLFPESSSITAWIGELSPVFVREDVVKGGAKPKPALLALLDEVDKRAAAQGAGFNRHSLPGTRAEFHKLAIAFNRRAFSKALLTFHDYLDGQCQFESSVQSKHGKGAAIWALFPEYHLTLG